MEDGEIGVVTKNDIKILDKNGNQVFKDPKEITWTVESAEKGGYQHFMKKEMHEQPKVVRDALSGRLQVSSKNVEFENFDFDAENIDKVYFVGCGTAYHASLIGKYLIEKIARTPVFNQVASEFRYGNPIIDEHTLVVAISQSGETADTLAAVRLAKEKGATTLGVVNVIGSTIDRECDYTIHSCAGPEIAVASTKAYTAQLICMYLLAVSICMKKEMLSEDDFEKFKSEMLSISPKIEEILNREEHIEDICKKYYKSKNVFFIGRGADYYVCKEGSLKLKEVAYIHSEAYEAGELKHGPIALIEPSTLVVGVVLDEDLIEKTLSNLKEVKARGAKVVCIAMDGIDVSDVADDVIYVPRIT